jgi:exosortase B
MGAPLDNPAPMPSGWLARGERRGLMLLAVCAAALFAPVFVELYQVVWRTDSQGQGPIIILLSGWLIWRRWKSLEALPARTSRTASIVVLAVAWLLYVLGRSQTILQFEVLSLIAFLAGLMLQWRGGRGLREIGFPLFFLIFAIPLPGVLVQTLTLPLKEGVSVVTENLLFSMGYPIARTGVTLQIGPYQLLVADACAGLNSMFTLESLGLLYMNIVGHTSKLRNVVLAILIIPISFVSNVVRVVTLVLVTYYFGDAAGQGFVHEFAGLVLFLVALVLMLAVDGLLGRVLRGRISS